MPRYEFHQDEKVTVWLRTRLTVEAASQEEAERLLKLSRNKTVIDRMNDIEDDCPVSVEETDVLFDTQENLSVAENGGKATVEIHRNSRGFHEDLVCTNDTEPMLLNIVPPEVPEFLRNRKTFEYGGLRFIPAYRFGELRDCNSFREQSRHISSVIEGGPFSFSRYDYGQPWDYDSFISCDTESDADVYYCIEAGDYFCPGRNELFRFSHPDLIRAQQPNLKN